MYTHPDHSDDSEGLLTIADHQMPAGFAPPPGQTEASQAGGGE